MVLPAQDTNPVLSLSLLPPRHNCIGFESFVFTAGCNLAFLALFVNFYLHAYPGKGKGEGKGKTSGKAAEGQSKTNKKET